MKLLNAELVNGDFIFPRDLDLDRKKVFPEKVLQFGEGNFLRGFVDWMIDRMNRQGLFLGSVVVIQPIREGLVQTLNSQDGLYTLYLRGIQNGKRIEKKSVISSISRAIDPYADFESYMKVAESEDLRFVISNTTEAGIAYCPDDIPTDQPPASFPGKLTVLLYRRFTAFDGDPSKGLVFIPCELIEGNGNVLRKIVIRLSKEWNYPTRFIRWIETSNYFLNSLVDRIVTGYPKEEVHRLTEELGYRDKLIDTGEIFHLWVIQGDQKFAQELPLIKAGLQVIWTDDLTPYRTRKVRILNGAHTMTVLAAYLYGLDTVKACMDDALIKSFMEKGLYEEIIPTLDLPQEDLRSFATAVSERFANPFINHYLLSISLNSTSKFKTRVLPSITEYIKRTSQIPKVLTFSLAALLAFYRGTEIKVNSLVGNRKAGTTTGNPYDINDDRNVLEMFQQLWQRYQSGDLALDALASTVLSKGEIWGRDLNDVSGFTAAVSGYLHQIITDGMAESLKRIVAS